MKKLGLCILLAFIASTMSTLSLGWAQGQAAESRIVYTADDPATGRINLYLSTVNGSNQRILYDSVSASGRALFSPDGKYIAVQNTSDQQLIMDTTGIILFRFSGGNRSDQDFIWGPDYTIYCGKYTSWYDGYPTPGIWRFRMMDSSSTRIFSSVSGVYDHNPAISPSGTQIAYLHHTYGYFACVYIMDADGKNIRRVTDSYGYSYVNYDEQRDLSWTDDKHLIFHAMYTHKFTRDGRELTYVTPVLFYAEVKDTVDEPKVYCPPAAYYYHEGVFTRIALSPDRKYVALYGADYANCALTLLSVSQLGSDSVDYTLSKLQLGHIVWSSNADYFIASAGGKLRIFDKTLREYRFANLPDIGAVRCVDWSRVDPGILEPVTGVNDGEQKPVAYALEQNYPNPFNPTTVIRYQLARATDVQLAVYDVLGQEMVVLVNGYQAVGTHETTFSGSNLPSGVYVYRLKTSDEFTMSKKMLLMK